MTKEYPTEIKAQMTTTKKPAPSKTPPSTDPGKTTP
jgi:hypothetical protein